MPPFAPLNLRSDYQTIIAEGDHSMWKTLMRAGARHHFVPELTSYPLNYGSKYVFLRSVYDSETNTMMMPDLSVSIVILYPMEFIKWVNYSNEMEMYGPANPDGRTMTRWFIITREIYDDAVLVR